MTNEEINQKIDKVLKKKTGRDYCGDLNAIFAAEKEYGFPHGGKSKNGRVTEHIDSIAQVVMVEDGARASCFYCTARQRSLGFLLAVGEIDVKDIRGF